MTYTEVHTITLHKPSKRNLQPSVTNDNATDIINSINNKSLRVQGWVLSPADPVIVQDDGVAQGVKFLYSMNLIATFSRDDNRPPNNHELPTIVRNIDTKGKNPAYGRWSMALVDDEEYVPSGERQEKTDLLGYYPVEIPNDYQEHFAHLYGLESHVKMIRKAIEAATLSGWTKRLHCALIGPPGCGKSDICKTLKRMLGDDAVLEFDATAMTSAGVIEDLREREILPRIVVIEEIEKADPSALNFLLALCDTRGEIRKTTARGKIERTTNMLVIATVNNYKLFTKLLSGALASRFANKIWFKRPSRDQLAMILTREVRSVQGSFDWIPPTLDYCDTASPVITDPRHIISLCLTGADDWTNGEFLKMLVETAPPAGDIEDEDDPFS